MSYEDQSDNVNPLLHRNHTQEQRNDKIMSEGGTEGLNCEGTHSLGCARKVGPNKTDPAMLFDILEKMHQEKELSPYISKFHPLKMGLKQV